jgi:hypothetical protein
MTPQRRRLSHCGPFYWRARPSKWMVGNDKDGSVVNRQKVTGGGLIEGGRAQEPDPENFSTIFWPAYATRSFPRN